MYEDSFKPQIMVLYSLPRVQREVHILLSFVLQILNQEDKTIPNFEDMFVVSSKWLIERHFS